MKFAFTPFILGFELQSLKALTNKVNFHNHVAKNILHEASRTLISDIVASIIYY